MLKIPGYVHKFLKTIFLHLKSLYLAICVYIGSSKSNLEGQIVLRSQLRTGFLLAHPLIYQAWQALVEVVNTLCKENVMVHCHGFLLHEVLRYVTIQDSCVESENKLGTLVYWSLVLLEKLTLHLSIWRNTPYRLVKNTKQFCLPLI